MDLLCQILSEILQQEKIEVTFPQLTIKIEELLQNTCFKALCEIKEILEDDTLDDEICFEKIEKIVLEIEKIGGTCGNRHDFG